MLKKNLFTFIFLCASILSFGQKEVATIENKPADAREKIKESFVVYDSKNESFALNLQGEMNNTLYVFDQNFQQTSQLAYKTVPAKFKEYLGSQIEDNTYLLYFSNGQKTKFAVQSLDVKNSNVSFKPVKIKLNKEKYLQSFSANNKFYILTVSKDISVIHLYTFSGERSKKKSIDFTKARFLNKEHKLVSLPSLLTFDFKFKKSIAKIDRYPNSVKEAYSKSKIYVQNNTLYFTLDHSHLLTMMISIDLNNFNEKITLVKKPTLKVFDGKRKAALLSNSFLIDDHLLQVIGSPTELMFQVQELQSNHIVFDKRITKNNPKSLVPTVTERTKKFLDTDRLLYGFYNGRVGISAYKNGSGYNIKVGWYDFASPAMTQSTAFTNSGPVTTTSFYGSTGLVEDYVNGFFSEDFKRVTDSLPESVFDKMIDFMDEKGRMMRNTIPFYHKNTHYLGFSMVNGSTYWIHRFD